jgi:hypothetical protein
MSIQDERELRGRLGVLLDGVELGPAPVATTMRLGRGIRMRKWVTAAAGVAVLAAGAVVLPGLIQGQRAVAPVASRHYKVTVQALGPTARGGVIGAGTINNKHWQIVVDKSLGEGCTTTLYRLTCGPGYSGAVGPREVSLNGATAGGVQFQMGTVGPDVTRVVIQLSDGTELDLRPVGAYGHRWVAVAAPLHAMIRAESFVGRSEYLYAVAYQASSYSEFVSWLRPGQPGLPRAAGQLGSGKIDGVSWGVSMSVGPWGLCVQLADGGGCSPNPVSQRPALIGKPLQPLTCGGLDNRNGKQIAVVGAVAIPAGVKNVVLKLGDGSHMRLVAIPLGGLRMIGYAIPNRAEVVRTLEYGFAGQLVGSASGANWKC